MSIHDNIIINRKKTCTIHKKTKSLVTINEVSALIYLKLIIILSITVINLKKNSYTSVLKRFYQSVKW